MKLHRIELIVVDFDSIGAEDILVDIDQSCAQLIRCVSTTTVDVGMITGMIIILSILIFLPLMK